MSKKAAVLPIPDGPKPDPHPELTAADTAPSKRNRTKADYLVLRRVTKISDVTLPGDESYWTEVEAENGGVETFEDTAEAVRFVRDNSVLGELWVVAVKRRMNVREKQTTTLEIT